MEAPTTYRFPSGVSITWDGIKPVTVRSSSRAVIAVLDQEGFAEMVGLANEQLNEEEKVRPVTESETIAILSIGQVWHHPKKGCEVIIVEADKDGICKVRYLKSRREELFYSASIIQHWALVKEAK